MNGSQKDAWGPAFGPWQNMMQAMFGGMDNATQGSEPAIKGLARLNLEMVALANRRAQAYLEIPQRLGRCRTPQDLVGEQMRFWQTAAEQYSETTRKALSIWTSMAPAVPAFKAPMKTAAVQERDYITFPEPMEQAAVKRAASPRRAA